MNQSTANPNLPHVTRLPLAKFSHTTTTIDHSGPLLWNHVNTAGDLTCVLERFMEGPSTSARLIIRVVRNDGILEQLDLSHFARLSAALDQPGQGTLPSKPPFAVVVKSPCLAVKYPHSNTHIRRFQIKFSQSADYFTALSLLTQANCPFTEGSTTAQPPQPPPTSSSWASFQAPLTASKVASTTVTSNNGTPVPFFPMPGYMPNEMTTPNPASSASNTASNIRGRNTKTRGKKPSPENPRPWMQSLATSSSKPTAAKKGNTRPTTAPAFHDQQLDEMLPPKRDLPFLKASQKKSQGQESDLSQISLGTPLERRPDDTSKNQTLVPAINDTRIIQDSQDPSSQPQSILATQVHQDLTLPVLVPSSQVQDTQLSQVTGFDQRTAESQSDVFGGEMIPMTQTWGVNADMQDVTCSQGKEVRSMVVSEDQLASYLTTPTPQRIAFLENWMCELIEDDRFITLCQDVESTWRRFALGNRENN